MKEYAEFSNMNADVDLSPERIKEIANIRISSIAMKNLQASINATNNLVPTMSMALLDMAAQISTISLESITQALSSISGYITETVASIQVPGLSEERRKGLTESYCAWGKCGWAWIGATPIKLNFIIRHRKILQMQISA